MRSALLAGLVAATTSGCVRFSYDRLSDGEPVLESAFVGLEAGRSDLGDCLRVLGAPTTVYPSESGFTTTLAWTWLDQGGLSLRASYPVPQVRGASPSFRFDSQIQKYRAVVATFGDDWGLVTIRRGYLREPGNEEVIQALQLFRR